MADFNWCHGPECHEQKTQDRIRGVKGSKVLRTRKVSSNHYIRPFGLEGGSIWAYFCSQSCLMDFVNTNGPQMLALAPRTECLETPIKDPEKTNHNNGYYNYSSWNIEVDETRQC